MQQNQFTAQDNFIEVRDPSELALCLILSAVYLGLAQYCWSRLAVLNNLKLFLNVEVFFIAIAIISFIVGIRPIISPSVLQISEKGLKYKSPYGIYRKSIIWEQVEKMYVSPELVIIIYRPNNKTKRLWPLFIASIYLSDRDSIKSSLVKFSNLEIIEMSNPHMISRLIVIFLFIMMAVWLIEMLMT